MPTILTASAVKKLVARARKGEPYETIAKDLGVTEGRCAAIARKHGIIRHLSRVRKARMQVLDTPYTPAEQQAMYLASKAKEAAPERASEEDILLAKIKGIAGTGHRRDLIAVKIALVELVKFIDDRLGSGT